MTHAFRLPGDTRGSRRDAVTRTIESGLRSNVPRERGPMNHLRTGRPRSREDPPPPSRRGGWWWRLACGLLLGAAGAAHAAGPSPAAADYGAVGYVEIDDVIDRFSDRYLARVIERARAENVDTLLVRIDTDGGEVLHARSMFKRVLDLEATGIRTVAFIDFRAISAGALIAYAHEEVYLSETASIGDIGVVFQSPEGEIKYAPEKFETVVRTLLTQAAEQRGWNRGMLLKMTAHKQSLYQVTLPGGAVHHVIEDDLPEFLAGHPGVDRDDTSQVFVYRGPDRLLTLTGLEAVKFGMASGNIADLDAMRARLGVSADEVVDLSPRGSERAAWALSRFAPVLAGLAVLFLLFELKTPGVGLWAGLATLLGAGIPPRPVLAGSHGELRAAAHRDRGGAGRPGDVHDGGRGTARGAGGGGGIHGARARLPAERAHIRPRRPPLSRRAARRRVRGRGLGGHRRARHRARRPVPAAQRVAPTAASRYERR